MKTPNILSNPTNRIRTLAAAGAAAVLAAGGCASANSANVHVTHSPAACRTVDVAASSEATAAKDTQAAQDLQRWGAWMIGFESGACNNGVPVQTRLLGDGTQFSWQTNRGEYQMSVYTHDNRNDRKDNPETGGVSSFTIRRGAVGDTQTAAHDPAQVTLLDAHLINGLWEVATVAHGKRTELYSDRPQDQAPIEDALGDIRSGLIRVLATGQNAKAFPTFLQPPSA